MKNNIFSLATWFEADDACDHGKATPLDIFIRNNEPAGDLDESQFREELQEAIKFVIADSCGDLLKALEQAEMDIGAIKLALPFKDSYMAVTAIERIRTALKNAGAA